MSQDAALLVFINCEPLTLNDTYIARQRGNNLHQRSFKIGGIMVHLNPNSYLDHAHKHNHEGATDA